MELDTNIMQTRTVREIVSVLRDIEKELVLNKNKQAVAQIINRHEIAMAFLGTHQN